MFEPKRNHIFELLSSEFYCLPIILWATHVEAIALWTYNYPQNIYLSGNDPRWTPTSENCQEPLAIMEPGQHCEFPLNFVVLKPCDECNMAQETKLLVLLCLINALNPKW